MDCELEQVVKFDKCVSKPYWRWYCACGIVGGRRPSEEASVKDHERHVSQQQERAS